MSIYVLDTSALLTYIENENGVAEIEQIVMETIDKLHILYISVISSIEVFYITQQEQGATIAHKRLRLLRDLPIIQELVRPDDVICIGELKAKYSMSFADSCIAGLAKKKSAILIHKDPEFEQLKSDVEQIILPYKTK